MSNCAECAKKPCRRGDSLDCAPSNCPSRNIGHEETLARYTSEEKRTACAAAAVEGHGYGRLTRVEEIMDYAMRCGYHRLPDRPPCSTTPKQSFALCSDSAWDTTRSFSLTFRPRRLMWPSKTAPPATTPWRRSTVPTAICAASISLWKHTGKRSNSPAGVFRLGGTRSSFSV